MNNLKPRDTAAPSADKIRALSCIANQVSTLSARMFLLMFLTNGAESSRL